MGDTKSTFTEDQARTLLYDWAETSARALAALLADLGFRLRGRVLQHDISGVTVAVRPTTPYRITFMSRDAPRGMGIVDLPLDTCYGVVVDIVTALHHHVRNAQS